MYVHSEVLWKCREYCWLPYLEKVKIGCIQDLEYILFAAVILPRFYRCQDFTKS